MSYKTNIDLDSLQIGDKVKTSEIYNGSFVEMLGENLTVVGKAVVFLSDTELMNEVKKWKHDFNPDDYE